MYFLTVSLARVSFTLTRQPPGVGKFDDDRLLTIIVASYGS
jgi:hypothetical protein